MKSVENKDRNNVIISNLTNILFSSEEKRSKKVVGTLADVSRTPQRFIEQLRNGVAKFS